MALPPERVPAGPLTYEDYAAIPNDGNRYEVLDGELYVTPAPVPRHQRVLANLFRIVDAHVRRHRLGELFIAPIDLILAPGSALRSQGRRTRTAERATIAQPDLLFIRAGRESIVTERAIEASPDLVVEILSPYSARQDRRVKAALYARFGVPCYWILGPAQRQFEGYVLAGKAYRLSSTASGAEVVTASPFPDLAISFGGVWA
jgi:Uma2 family endonuclease